LKGKSLNSKTTIKWNHEALQAFESIKQVLDYVSFLAYPAPGEEIALITDASNFAIGAVLHQKVKNEWLEGFPYIFIAIALLTPNLSLLLLTQNY